MKYNQNQKILQITESTLIIGIDVASVTHYARAFDYRGLEIGKCIKFNNDAEGFTIFKAWVTELKSKNQKDKVIAGVEPTGHYWFALAQYLKDNSMKTVIVNPLHVKRTQELDDNNPGKNDRKDPKTIAMLVKDGRYLEPYIPEGVYGELRVAMETRWQLVQQLNAIRNRVQRWISIYFPEFKKVFAGWEGKAALVALKEFPTPAKVLEKDVEEVILSWKGIRTVGRKRAILLMEAAKTSTGIREGLESAENALINLLEDYELRMRQIERLMANVERLSYQVPGFQEVLKIPGVGLVTAAGFIAEVGDINRFEHPKQVQKLAGLGLKENSSGKHKGKTTISKRGRRRLRALLFQGILPLVANNKEFKQLHQYYISRAENPLTKKQSLILLCCKLIRIIFALLTKQVAYDPQKMMGDIKRPALQQAA